LALLGGFWLIRTLTPVGPTVPTPPTREITPPVQPTTLDANGEELEAPAGSPETAAEFAWRQDQLARLEQQAASPPLATRDGGASASEANEPAAPRPGNSRNAHWERFFDASDFDASELLDRGMPSGEVENLRRISERNEMQRTAITKRAKRAGSPDKRRHRNELVELERATHAEIGDASYDALLYATGRENRVQIRVLLENSPERSFGLQPGDVVLSYDGRPVFRAPDLREAARQGNTGESVPVDVLRDGHVVPLSGRRGPIPARLQPARIVPEALW